VGHVTGDRDGAVVLPAVTRRPAEVTGRISIVFYFRRSAAGGLLPITAIPGSKKPNARRLRAGMCSGAIAAERHRVDKLS
jgi:hypothetical protein